MLLQYLVILKSNPGVLNRGNCTPRGTKQ